MTEPRVIRRAVKSGYTTRRSVSEANARSAMYFPEVDVDVRTGRPRVAEPDLSHIKSSEDISSGYSSADNSVCLTRTASLGPAARVRAKTTRTTVTTIKRPQAAEDDEVIIEELQDDDNFEYSSMPPLVNIHKPIFLSNTDPPFLYQQVGDQIKIVQVLGSYPSNETNVINTNAIETDQMASDDQVSDKIDVSEILESKSDEGKAVDPNDKLSKTIGDDGKSNVEHSDVGCVEATSNQLNSDECKNASLTLTLNDDSMERIESNRQIDTSDNKPLDVADTLNSKDIEKDKAVSEIDNDMSSLDNKSLNDHYSADSEDEGSFGTPEDSPKNKRKSPKGRYGKGKAPSPPKVVKDARKKDSENLSKIAIMTTSEESLVDIINNLSPDSLNDSGATKSLQVMNPIAEKKQHHKNKSPARGLSKGNSSSIVKLLQLPSKLAFWNKNDDKSKKDNASNSSNDNSRRSSTTVEQVKEDFQNCLDDITPEKQDLTITLDNSEVNEDQISFKDASDFESDAVSLNIIEKSDALQKLIEAKIESHPEYKYVSVDDLPSTSKSTDV